MAQAAKQLFLSYTRVDKEKVQGLLQALRRLKYTVWLDEEISGGQEWWNMILSQLRSSDAVIVAVSPAALDSEACGSEVTYALQVRRPVLPVMVEAVGTNVLPPQIARLNVVDFTGGGDQVFDLVGALNRLPAPGPLPDPLPDPPKVPISYLSDLSRLVHAPQLDYDEQLSLLGRLRAGLARPRERKDVLQLLQTFHARRDIFAVVDKEITRTLEEWQAEKDETASAGRARATRPEVPTRDEAPARSTTNERARHVEDSTKPNLQQPPVEGRSPPVHASPSWGTGTQPPPSRSHGARNLLIGASVGIVVLILIIIAVASGGSAPSQNSGSVQPTTTEPPPAASSPPTPAASAIWNVALVNVTHGSTYKGYTVTRPQAHFIIIRATFANRTSSIEILSGQPFDLTDSAGQHYPEDQASLPGSSTTIGPGQSQQFDFAYVVPNASCSFKLAVVLPSANTDSWTITSRYPGC